MVSCGYHSKGSTLSYLLAGATPTGFALNYKHPDVDNQTLYLIPDRKILRIFRLRGERWGIRVPLYNHLATASATIGSILFLFICSRFSGPPIIGSKGVPVFLRPEKRWWSEKLCQRKSAQFIWFLIFMVYYVNHSAGPYRTICPAEEKFASR